MLQKKLDSFEISVHRPKHKYPQNDLDWGYYLSGLIDADGSFTNVLKNKPNLTIAFHNKDISLAYKIRQFLGYGTVSKIKNKNACKYVLTNSSGFIKLLPLLKNKLQHIEKYNRYLLLCDYFDLYKGESFAKYPDLYSFWNNIYHLETGTPCTCRGARQINHPIKLDSNKIKIQNFVGGLCTCTSCRPHALHRDPQLVHWPVNQPHRFFSLLNNYWFAGFIDGDGSFQIKIIKRQNRKVPEIRLQLQIELNHNYKYLLDSIIYDFGGNLGFRNFKENQNQSFYYNSTSYQVFKQVVSYLDQYPLCSNKYKEYVIWRKAYFYKHQSEKIVTMKKLLSQLKH